MERLSRDTILRAFDRLTEELRASNAKCELVLAGGAAMLLVYNARESTRDVDAVLIDGPRPLFEAAVGKVVARFSLSANWLNDGFKGYLEGVSVGPIVYASETLLIKAVAFEQLLAMKLSAHRDEVDNMGSHPALPLSGLGTESALCF